MAIGLSPIFSGVSVENTTAFAAAFDGVAVYTAALDGVALDGVASDSAVSASVVSDNTAASSSPVITRTALDGDASFRDG